MQMYNDITKSWLMHLLTIICIIPLYVNICIVDAASQVVNKNEPMFISRSEAFKFAVGDVITLPCEVTHPGNYVTAWKRGIAILTAGSVKVTPDPRVRLVNGYTLQIRDAVPSDAGDYICQIATLEPREITHHVEILIPPKIEHVTSGGHLQVKKGSPVRLECSATGNPMPNITWTRKNNLLPNGEEKFVSSSYIIENMDRHKGGTYLCTANNGVGQVASSQIVLHVLYPPEIVVDNPLVYSGEGQDATLSCIVHGETAPNVSWLKDTVPVDQVQRYVAESRGTRHSLTIHRVNPLDFGNFSCVAENQLGKTKKTVTLTGRPRAAKFRSAPQSQWKDKYNISWTVDSYSPIEEYKLYYKLIGHDDVHGNSNPLDNNYLKDVDGYPQHLSPNYKEDPDLKSSFDTFSYHNGYGSYIQWPKTEWRDIILPAIPYTQHYIQGMSYTILGLEPDQQYEAKVLARNRYGWSDFSERFVFSTSHIDTEIRDMGVTHYSSTSSASKTSSSNLILLFNLKFCICTIFIFIQYLFHC